MAPTAVPRARHRSPGQAADGGSPPPSGLSPPSAPRRCPAPDPQPHHVRRSPYPDVDASPAVVVEPCGDRRAVDRRRLLGAPRQDAGHVPLRDESNRLRRGVEPRPSSGRGRRSRRPATHQRGSRRLRLHAAEPPPSRDADPGGAGRRARAGGGGRGHRGPPRGTRLRPRGRPHPHLRRGGRAGPQQHLCVPERRHPQHPGVRERVPRCHDDRARAELPIEPDHPRRRQRGDRQQPQPQAQGAVDRPGPRARHRALPRRRRGRREPVGGPPDQPPPRRWLAVG